MNTGQRILLRFTSALIGLLLVTATLLGIGHIVSRYASSSDFILPVNDWYTTLRTTPWSSAGVVYAAIGLLVVGTLLALISLVTRPRLFALAQPTEGMSVVIAPRAVAQMLRQQAEAVPGVATASVEVSAERIRVSASAPVASPDRVSRDLEEGLTHALKKIPWNRLPRIELELTDGGAR